MRIVLLGGSGFVGTRLTELLLADGHQVTIGDLVESKRYPELWKKCDVRNSEELVAVCSGVDVIVNLAAAHRDDVRPISLYYETNVDGARCVCQAAMQCGVRRIVFTSSVAIYGFPEYEYDEDGPKHPFNDYGKSKLEAEAVYQEWLNAAPENRLQVVRPTAIFGEGNRGNIYNLFHQLARRRFLMIGNGKNKKSIAYVGNVAAFLKWYIEADPAKYKVCNFIDKPDLDMYDLVALFEKDFRRKVTLPVTLPYWLGLLGGYGFDVLAWVLHRSLPISSIRIRKFCAQSIFSTRRLEETGFIPPFTIEEGIRRTIAFEFSPKK